MLRHQRLSLTDSLFLTCSRSGFCCHDNRVRLNAWELHCLAQAKQISVQEFREAYCDGGGAVLRFIPVSSSRHRVRCSLHATDWGCSVHGGRPLACRLYPLGRQRQGQEWYYMYQGAQFPCLVGCPEVQELPVMTVQDYLQGQEVSVFEQAQDAYLELVQDLAESAFSCLLDTPWGLDGVSQVLHRWEQLGSLPLESLVAQVGSLGVDRLMVPFIEPVVVDFKAFYSSHRQLLQNQMQSDWGTLTTREACHGASVSLMAQALFLAYGVGAEPQRLALRWVKQAKQLI